MPRMLICLVCIVFLALVTAAWGSPGTEDLLGVTAAKQRMRGAMPTGRGIMVGQVEGGAGRYAPSTAGDRYRGITFYPRSGDSTEQAHASSVLRVFAGSDGLAPGVREVHLFSTWHWITDGYLHAGQARPPAEDKPQLFSHSWVGRGAGMSPAEVAHVLRRVDYAIDAHGVLMCVAVDNGRDRPVPGLLSSAYNVIAVGRADGHSSGGGTQIEVVGRSKPDITAPAGTTSTATPMVTALTARLLQSTRGYRDDADDASRPETIKALLMAGATKPAGWEQGADRPLDDHLGAGVAHLDNSLRVLQAGRARPDLPRPRHGWDLHVMDPGQEATYHLASRGPVAELSLVLVWHRRIDGRVMFRPPLREATWLDVPRLARFDVRVYAINNTGDRRLIAKSVSDIDNVKHIHLLDLAPGDYHFVISRRSACYDEPWPVAIAWRAGQTL
jgi:hypothetical protein